MDVYRLTGFGNYGAGVAVVVAPSVEDARNLGRTIVDNTWHTDYATSDIEKLDLKDSGPERVVTHFEYGE